MKKLMIFAFLLVLFVVGTSSTFAEDPAPATSTSTSSYTVPQSYYNSQNPSAVSTPTPTPVPAEATSIPVPAESTAPTESAPVQVTVSAKVVYKENSKAEDGSENKDGGFYIESPDGKTSTKVNGSVGYDGGFFIKSDDGKFKLKINGKGAFVYEGALMEHVNNAHGGKPKVGLTFSGNCFTEDLTYKIAINPISFNYVELKYNTEPEPGDEDFNPLIHKFLKWSPIASVFDIGYAISPLIAMHLQYGGPWNDDAGSDFILPSFGGYRYPADTLTLGPSGTYKRLTYALAVFQRADSWYFPNLNNELGYAGRFDYNIITGSDTKPALDVAVMGNFYHEEEATEARVIIGAANLRLTYKEFGFGTEGVWRQIDPDQFTLAQSDATAMAWAAYNFIPSKLQLAVRFSHTFDDLTDSGSYLGALETPLNYPNIFTPTINGQVFVGDAAGDIANEWEASAQLSYWPLGSPNLILRTQYMFVNDGVVGGGDSIQSHIIDFLASVGF